MSSTEQALPHRRASAAGALRVAVLMGGASGEREVSLLSGKAVALALGARVAAGELAQLREVELGVDGRWSVDGQAHPAARALELLHDVDVFFLGLHGGAGEDGTLQGLLTAAGRCHTGSGVAASAICMDKAATRGLAAAAGLRVAPGRLIDARAFAARREQELQRALELAVRDAWVVKPRRGGSSVNTHLVRERRELEIAIRSVLASGDDALVEAQISGVEVSCGVLDFAGEQARALPPIEIQPARERFFDYQQKYSESGAREFCPAPSLDAPSEARVRDAALALHRLCGCSGYSRSDFIVPAHGDPVLLEINTLPGLTPRSLLPQEAAAVGIGFPSLCLGLVETAWKQRRA